MQSIHPVSLKHETKSNDGYLWWIQPISKNLAHFQQPVEAHSVRDLLAELKICICTRNLRRGREVHALAKESGNDSSPYVSLALVRMYAKCGRTFHAQKVFDAIKEPDVEAWNALILGYAEKGEGETALKLFTRMKAQGCAPDPFTYTAALKACVLLALSDKRTECLEMGKEIHAEIGTNTDAYVESALIDMYAKSGCMDSAREVFDNLKYPCVVSWTSLISGYADNGDGITALRLFVRMKYEGCSPDSFIFVAALKACTCLAESQDERGKAECLEHGREIHSQVGRHLNLYVQNTLIHMYSKCGSMVNARSVFDSIKRPDVVSWSSLMLGYAENGEGIVALDLFSNMKDKCCAPNSVTYVAALKACSSLGALESGCKIHSQMNIRMECDAVLVTCFVDFYSKCGYLAKAQKVFDDSHPKAKDLTTWNALLAGYSRLGDEKTVSELLQGMQDAGLQPNRVTFLSILSCCSHAGLVDRATDYFEQMPTKYEINPGVEHYTCMVDMLGRSNKLDDAKALLRTMPCRVNQVTWMTVLAACRKWKNVGVGMLAFQSLISLDDKAFVVMAVNGSRGMWEEQILGVRTCWGQTCWTNGVTPHVFLIGNTIRVEERVSVSASESA